MSDDERTQAMIDSYRAQIAECQAQVAKIKRYERNHRRALNILLREVRHAERRSWAWWFAWPES